jgi:hypothetical protein
MKSLIPIATLLACAALTASAAAQTRDDGLRLKIVQPITFDPQTGCIGYGLASRGKTGTGTNCIVNEVPAQCPSRVTADFCVNVLLGMTLTLPGGRLDVPQGAIFEAWTCVGGAYAADGSCTSLWNVDQRWSGTVTQATGKYRDLRHASVSGGGLLVFDGPTFNIVSINETLVIRQGDNEEEGDN